MTRRSLVLTLLGWTTVVALMSVAVWQVIDGVGGELGESVADVTAGSPSPTLSLSSPSATATPSRRPPTPTSPTGTPPAAPPSATASPSPTAAPVPTRVRTWQGPGGSVTVACTGSTLRLEGATPSDGYRVDKNESNGGRELEVEFERTSGDEDRTEIHVTCRGGVPIFAVDDSSSDD